MGASCAKHAGITIEGCSKSNNERALGHAEHVLFIEDTQLLPMAGRGMEYDWTRLSLGVVLSLDYVAWPWHR